MTCRSTIIRHPQNLGYGGNQKAGYRLAIEHGLDIVVLLHGDGQYAPECLEEIVAPLERGECDAVLGSRMMDEGAARHGRHAAYKYVGNRILTKIRNRTRSITHRVPLRLSRLPGRGAGADPVRA